MQRNVSGLRPRPTCHISREAQAGYRHASAQGHYTMVFAKKQKKP